MPLAQGGQKDRVRMEDEEEGKKGAGTYAKAVAKILFSHVGLAVLVLAYVVGGAYLFKHLEGGGEEQRLQDTVLRSNDIEAERETLAQNLWNYKYGPSFNITVETMIEDYHALVTESILHYSYKGVPETMAEQEPKWGVASAILFTVSIVTTIGYGHVTPVTELGQLLVIAYSLVGIPLMLMFLANIGDAMARFFRVAYGKGCCYCCNKRRQKEYEKAMVEHKQRPRDLHPDDVGDIPKNRPRTAWSEDGSDLRLRKTDPEQGGKRDSFGMDPMNKDRVVDDPGAAALDAAEDVINVPISLTLVIIAAYVFIGAILFAAWNDWTWITGAYFSFVTLSTIGFGDLIPGWSEVGTTAGTIKLAVSAFYIVLGLAVLSMSFNLMMEEMIAKFEWVGKKMGIVDDPATTQPMSTEVKPFIGEEHPPAIESVGGKN